MTLGNILENFAPNYGLAIGARIAVVMVVMFTVPLTAHSLRGSVLALFYENKYDNESVPRSLIAVIASLVILGCGLTGVIFTKIEVVLAYKGGIFGSCLVYIFPPLMLVALRLREERREDGSTCLQTMLMPPSLEDGDTQPPASFRSTLIAMFTRRQNWYLAVMFSWGILAGTLSVGVTILSQAGLLKN
jgi:hypothetical protein